MEHCEPSHL